jgi:hypothetical protein
MNQESWYELIKGVDFIVYLYFLFSVSYLFIFALFSCRRRRDKYFKSQKQYRFAVLFPAYKADQIICESVISFLKQKYPKEKYDIVVISENMKESTNQRLSELPITLMQPRLKNSIIARELEYAVKNLDPKSYDVAVVLEANNTVDPNFLEEINKAYHSGGTAIQTHRVSKNLHSNTSVLDAISEEINNSIFRKGHVRMGFSGALIGSGMAFNFDWLKKNIHKVTDKYIAKQLEAILLKQGIFIDYLDDVYTYAEKIQDASSFYKQRKEWLSSQSNTFWRFFTDLPRSFFAGNFDYADKILQWMMLPRVLLLTFTILISCSFMVYDWTLSIKWLGLLLLLALTFSLSIPEKFMNARTFRALFSLPGLALLMFFGLFGRRRRWKKGKNNYEL